jgi:hypothetical protein
MHASPLATHVVTVDVGIARELHEDARGTGGALRSRMRITLLSALLVSLVGCITESSAPTFGGRDDFGGGGKADGLDNPVRLRFATTKDSTDYKWLGVIDIADRGTNKSVDVVWRSEGGAWHETPAQFLAVTDNGHPDHQLWSFRGVGEGVEGVSEMWVRYRAGGTEYASEHYRGRVGQQNGFGAIALSAPMGAGIDVATKEATFVNGISGSALDVTVLVRNVAFEKELSIVYTTDDWETYDWATGHYVYGDGTIGGGERWDVHLDLPAGTSNIEYAVSATQNGNEAWDNNFTRNFGCTVDPGEARGICWGLTFVIEP